MSDPLVPILIPAYQPTDILIELAVKLVDSGLAPIWVVNDGSHSRSAPIFAELERLSGVSVIHHAVNQGKGAALKTGINAALTEYPDLIGIVTVDADGQHAPADTLALKRRFLSDPTALTLGVREFKDTASIPWRSRFGNTLTRRIFQLLTGQPLLDTQTGLRAIPTPLLRELLGVSTNGYEFETDMLLLAIRSGTTLVQHPITTVYIDGNSSSHFNPLLDSLKIYFVLFRFALNSAFTGIIDFSTFAISQYLGASILTSSVLGRIFAGSFNFLTSKRFVFHSSGSLTRQLAKYISLVAFLLFISNSAISALVRRASMDVYLAKLLVETSLFIVSFSIQRTFIFTRSRQRSGLTDWNSYYEKPAKATTVTRKITIGRILEFLKPFHGHLEDGRCVEFGGGNSCVYESIRKRHSFRSYQVLDTNPLGVDLFNRRAMVAADCARIADVLRPENFPSEAKDSDLCLSIGLIEHFDESGTRQAIRSHFESTTSSGLVLITYPTPTWLYRITRGLAEALGIWKFPDERPLTKREVSSEIEKHGRILRHEVIWSIFLTQGIVLSRKK